MILPGHTLYTPPDPTPPPPAVQSVTPAGRKNLGIGAVLGVVLFALPFTRFVLSYLDVLAHELGHALAAWGFGFPAVPAFDWRYGGGVTLSNERSIAVLLICYGIFAVLLFRLRARPGPRNLLSALLVVYSIAAFTPLHEIVQLAMGHAMELLIAGIFLYRAIAGRAVTHAVERPLYAACAVFMILQNTALAWGLMRSAEARELYGAAKGGGHWMDLSRIAHDYLGVGLPAVAFLLFLACLATPCASYLAYRYEPLLTDRLERWLMP